MLTRGIDNGKGADRGEGRGSRSGVVYEMGGGA